MKDLGYDANGNPYFHNCKLFEDALSQPHLLIAGATGSGKSVIVNWLIYQAIQRSNSRSQLILIDPKRVELSIYRDLPHTVRYASEPLEMVEALRYAMELCEQRYTEMQRQGVRKYRGGDLWVVIDEFADLMTTNGKIVKPLIQRLAQIGRAARVHIILATQTPIAKVIPTEIKCNFDSRFGLRARSAQDSVNILGHTGLERLPKYGQAVYMTPDGENLYNIPFLDDDEIMRLVNYIESFSRSFKRRGFLSRLFG